MARYQIDNIIAMCGVGIVLLLGAALFLYVVRRRMSEHHELRRALLEKIGTEELVRLAESGEGRAFLRDLFGGASDARSGLERALQMIFAGLACGLGAHLMHNSLLGIAGLLLVGTGAGQLLAVIFLRRRNRKSDET